MVFAAKIKIIPGGIQLRSVCIVKVFGYFSFNDFERKIAVISRKGAKFIALKVRLRSLRCPRLATALF